MSGYYLTNLLLVMILLFRMTLTFFNILLRECSPPGYFYFNYSITGGLGPGLVLAVCCKSSFKCLETDFGLFSSLVLLPIVQKAH